MAWHHDPRYGGWYDPDAWPELDESTPLFDEARAAVAGDDAGDDPTTYTKDDGSVYQRARPDEFEDGD